ncbi:alpha/beta hydrolase [Candidatus Daviesbacteria bacterium]|nr:alpha/beta hydrolase [Candidatus Daviesbacteria bacterium]
MRLIISTLTWSIVFLSFNSPIFAEEYYFQEEFNQERAANTLDTNKWNVYPNNSSGITTIQETGGNLILSQVTADKFPFVISNSQVFPNGDWVTDIKFQYTQITGYGTGIALTDKDPIQDPTAPELIRINVWQDLFLTNMRLEYFGQIIFTIPINLDSHVFKVDRRGLKYLVYLDDVLVFTSEDTETKVKYIWMGNYVTVPAGDWTKFNVDYVRVKSLKTPLILIPGIGGSEFKVAEDTFWSKEDGHGGVYTRAYAKDEKVWVNEGEAGNPGDDDYFDVLRMKTDGINSEANIETTGSLYAGAYQPMIDFFTTNGYSLNQDLFVFPYDWRKDISLTASLLDQKISEIKSQTGAEKVDIVSHSMGGLVARNYIADIDRAQNVRKLFTLGTPHLGAVEFLKFLRYGGCFTKPEFKNLPVCIGLANSEVKDVIQNMIGGYELAPSQEYFNFYSDEDNFHPYPYRTEKGSLNYGEIKSLLTNFGHNTSLFMPSETFHNLDNSLLSTNGVDITVIAGCGIETLGQIVEKTVSSFNGNRIYKDEININGDGTVPLLSASLVDTHKNLSLLGDAKIYYANSEHGGLVSDGPALNLTKNILDGNNQLPEGTYNQPCKLRGHILSVHSPVNLHVYDEGGNHTGPTEDGHFETNIPGSSYNTLDDAKFTFLPEDGVYTIKFNATGEGSFDFKIRKYENDEITQTILYKEVPLTNDTKAETTFDTGSTQSPIIEVDENGDGIIDFNVNNFSILEGNANYDHTPPDISFDVTPKTIWPPNGKLVDVNVTGNINDENPYLTKIIVDDEYNLVEPEVTILNQTNINQIIQLEASRKGGDKDGRKYIIKILVTDLAGNTSLSTQEVIVPHDQSDSN